MTPILIPFRNLFIIIDSLNEFKNKEIVKIIKKEGRTTPRVETTAPVKLLTLYPIKVAQFIEIGPGVHSEIEIISSISSDVMNLYF